MVRNTAPCCEDVRDKQGEAAVVIEPPDIDGSSSLLGALLELGDVSHDLLRQWPLGDIIVNYVKTEKLFAVLVTMFTPALIVLIH